VRIAYATVNDESTVAALREALALSPENLPLRLHLANVLLAARRTREAAEAYRAVLAVDAHHREGRLGLAKALESLGEDAEALAIIDTFQDEPEPPAAATLLYSRLKARAGDTSRAASAYRAAIEADPALADEAFALSLRVREADEHGAEPVPPDAVVEKPTITFADVGGMRATKDAIRAKIIAPLEHPDLYRAYGKSTGGGILLYGPPGVGKTFLARATAGEAAAHFISVGIEDVLDMWFGRSEHRLHATFTAARRAAPCVLFFDEVDALAASRLDMRGSSGRTLVNQFLAELDGVKDSNDGVLVLAATNAPWHLDAAFKRPGRFDRVLFVPPPDAPARAEILRLMLRDKPLGAVDYAALAKRTDGFSGADLRGVVDVAVERKLEEAIAAGAPRPIVTNDLATAIAHVRPSTREWLATARNYALYANEGGNYDDIVAYLKL